MSNTSQPSVPFGQQTPAGIQLTFHTQGAKAARETGLFSCSRGGASTWRMLIGGTHFLIALYLLDFNCMMLIIQGENGLTKKNV